MVQARRAGSEQRLRGKGHPRYILDNTQMCPGGQTGLAGTEGVFRGGARCRAGEGPETQGWIPRWHATKFGHHLCSGEAPTVFGKKRTRTYWKLRLLGKEAEHFQGRRQGCLILKNKHPLFQHQNRLSVQHRCRLGLHNHQNPVALESHHKVQSCHHFLATGYNQLGHSWGHRCPGGMD